MELIIQQIALELVKSWKSVILEHGLVDIDITSNELLEVSKSNCLELLSRLLKELDNSFFEARSMRKDLDLRVKERRRSRDFLTNLGWLHYDRSYYSDENKGEYLYPVDDMVGISSYERIGGSVSAALLQSAAFVSMRSSSDDVTSGDLSAQSVCNKLRLVGTLENDLPEERRDVNELHIFADEDHVSLQNGKSKIVPLVSISEGVRKVSKNRNATINAVHFTSDASETDSLWRKVYAYVDKAYNINNIEKIYIHGDGASWIKKSFNEFSNACFVLDGFHLGRRLKPFITETNAEYVRELLSGGKQDDFKILANNVIKNCNDAVRKNRLKDNLNYLLNQWDGVVNRFHDGTIGSCTEAMVSHVLSERLSRDPMGWSEDGLNAMAALRVYVKNGGIVTRAHFKRSDEEKQTSKLVKYADEMMKTFLDFKLDLSIFDNDKQVNGKVTPVSVILKSFGSIKSTNNYCKN